jgi:hypothetical protein
VDQTIPDWAVDPQAGPGRTPPGVRGRWRRYAGNNLPISTPLRLDAPWAGAAADAVSTGTEASPRRDRPPMHDIADVGHWWMICPEHDDA